MNAADFGEIVEQGQAKISKQPTEPEGRQMKNLRKLLISAV